jgi:GNAT superfamily N-acetyltransferase
MNAQTYLIDTNVIIGLEDNHTVQPAFAELHSLAARHQVGIFVHEAARDDIARDKNESRRCISLSKLDKFQQLMKVRGLTEQELETEFGPLRKHNDVVDATLLHALKICAVDFLVTQDKGLHERARRFSSELGRRVLHVADAVDLLKITFDPKESRVRYIEEALAHTIPLNDEIFVSLREDYLEFDKWWREKCVAQHRSCWIVYDDCVAGLVVRKDESSNDTDSTKKCNKILKLCTFKVRPEKRGTKLGELLLKKIFWFAQVNSYDLVYVTTYRNQVSLIDLLEYYGFINTYEKSDGELIYEKEFSTRRLERKQGESLYETDRLNYPRFIAHPDVRAFGIPIRELYHDTLYPDLKSLHQPDLFENDSPGSGPKTPGNTIRKVYLCRAPSNLATAGSLLFFYKGKSKSPPSQALTAIGILEEVALAKSTKDLMLLTGGRSVYSEQELEQWNASKRSPVKVINYLLVSYIDPIITLPQLVSDRVFKGHPPQSIFEISGEKLQLIIARLKLGFDL